MTVFLFISSLLRFFYEDGIRFRFLPRSASLLISLEKCTFYAKNLDIFRILLTPPPHRYFYYHSRGRGGRGEEGDFITFAQFCTEIVSGLLLAFYPFLLFDKSMMLPKMFTPTQSTFLQHHMLTVRFMAARQKNDAFLWCVFSTPGFIGVTTRSVQMTCV